MPIFDRSAARPSRAEADFLRSVLGPRRHGPTSLRQASRDYRLRQRRGSVARALVVLVLLGCLFGAAIVMSEQLPPSRSAAPILPHAAGTAPSYASALKTRSRLGEVRTATHQSQTCKTTRSAPCPSLPTSHSS
jgi:hypothetical protein